MGVGVMDMAGIVSHQLMNAVVGIPQLEAGENIHRAIPLTALKFIRILCYS